MKKWIPIPILVAMICVGCTTDITPYDDVSLVASTHYGGPVSLFSSRGEIDDDRVLNDILEKAQGSLSATFIFPEGPTNRDYLVSTEIGTTLSFTEDLALLNRQLFEYSTLETSSTTWVYLSSINDYEYSPIPTNPTEYSEWTRVLSAYQPEGASFTYTGTEYQANVAQYLLRIVDNEWQAPALHAFIWDDANNQVVSRLEIQNALASDIEELPLLEDNHYLIVQQNWTRYE